ncbi:MAG: hypothetical protein L0229_24225, partial [Blastocatellia bacterium]|nr:hypothetical protein [Blastocatellia bacterium]
MTCNFLGSSAPLHPCLISPLHPDSERMKAVSRQPSAIGLQPSAISYQGKYSTTDNTDILRAGQSESFSRLESQAKTETHIKISFFAAKPR